MKKKLIFFCSILTFLIVVGSLLIAVGSLYKEKRIESETIDNDYYMVITSDNFKLNSGSTNDYIFTKNNKRVAKITYFNKNDATKYINLIKSSNNIKILDVAQNKSKTGVYYFFKKGKKSITYNYIFIYSHTAVLIESVVSKNKTKEIPLNINFKEQKHYVVIRHIHHL